MFLIFNLSAAKKLGGKLDVVSYHDEVEGGIFNNIEYDNMIVLIYLDAYVILHFCVQLRENLQALHQESMPQKQIGPTLF